MKRQATLRGASCLFVAVTALRHGEARQARATETVTPNIPGVVAGGTKVQLVKDGLEGTDGPIGLPDGRLIFWESGAKRINTIDRDGNISTFLDNVNGSNSLAFDAKGRLLSVQRLPAPAKIVVIFPTGSETVLADNFEGKAFGRPNDLVADSRGGVYFTDSGARGEQRNTTLPPAVYYISPEGRTIRIADGLLEPNGIQLSLDGRVLYVNESHSEYMVAFDVQPDGTARNRRNFARYETSGVNRAETDGLAVDSEGRIYSAGPVGIEVFSTRGEYLGTIPVSKRPQNLAFAGPGKRTLYIAGQGAIFKVQMLTQGPTGRAR